MSEFIGTFDEYQNVKEAAQQNDGQQNPKMQAKQEDEMCIRDRWCWAKLSLRFARERKINRKRWNRKNNKTLRTYTVS